MSANYHRKIVPLKRMVVNLLLALLTLSISLSFVTSVYAENRTYGPVKQNDFLSKIVSKSYPNSSLTNDQIMVAILRANPESFRGGNIHFLRLAVSLTLPGDNDIASIPAKEASALVAQHLVYFKQGKTGNFVNKPLVLSTRNNSNSGKGSQPVEKMTKEDQPESEPKQATSKVPSKIKVEVRKEKQEKENNFKHVVALEKISNQQNKALRTLDEHIRLLEEQLKADSQEDKAAEKSSAKASDDVVKNDDTADDIYAKNAISSLEARLSISDKNNNQEVEVVEVNNKTDPIEPEISPVTDDNLTDNIEALVSESVSQEAVSQSDVKLADPVIDTPVTPDTSATFDTGVGEALAFENTNSSLQQPEGGVALTTQGSSSSFVSTLKSMSKVKLFTLLGAFILGLFAFSYFFFGRNAQQKTSAVTTPLRKEKFTEIVGSPLQIPDAESLLNPVIRTKASDDAAPIHSGSSTIPTGKSGDVADNENQDAELKINMARAYMDMSYIDASKEILKEVISEGSKEQKETAQQMLSMI